MPSEISNSNRLTGRFYDFAGWFYPVIEPWLRGPRQRLVDCINAEPPGRMLEIGMGPGYHLSSYHNHHVTAIDVSGSMLKQAARRCQSSEITLLRMDGEQLAFADDVFDSVVLAHVLSVTADPNQMLAEVHRVLKEGGRAFVLNHERPASTSRLWGALLSLSCNLLRLKFSFRLADLDKMKQFTCLQRLSLGWGERFSLSILQK
jgi:phosphatidylethanolamine/phosphatidyl-N-methylethanolamine N-methyltransferase